MRRRTLAKICQETNLTWEKKILAGCPALGKWPLAISLV